MADSREIVQGPEARKESDCPKPERHALLEGDEHCLFCGHSNSQNPEQSDACPKKERHSLLNKGENCLHCGYKA